MHELSIAMNIVEMATEKAIEAQCRKVLSVEIEVGTLAGVVVEALEFAMEAAVKETVVENARVNITQIAAVAQCNQCHYTFPVEDLYTLCPTCQSYDTRLLRGNELRLKSLTAE